MECDGFAAVHGARIGSRTLQTVPRSGIFDALQRRRRIGIKERIVDANVSYPPAATMCRER